MQGFSSAWFTEAFNSTYTDYNTQQQFGTAQPNNAEYNNLLRDMTSLGHTYDMTIDQTIDIEHMEM